ncbi:MAG: NADH-quinone oxidoreductase subunit NuoK [Bdellovibrionota bacterium]
MAGLATHLPAYLIFSAMLFSFGLIAALGRRSTIGIFMGVELMLNGAGLNFVAFQTLRAGVIANDNWLHGHIFALFVIILAAIEAAVALAIVLRTFGTRQTIEADRADELRG